MLIQDKVLDRSTPHWVWLVVPIFLQKFVSSADCDGGAPIRQIVVPLIVVMNADVGESHRRKIFARKSFVTIGG
jgi:hypothetical protein